MLKYLLESWQHPNILTVFLLPLSGIYFCLYSLNKTAYRLGLFKQSKMPVPVIVIGNITVGGTGKTPITIWLANFLKNNGYRPGIISRGYGRKSKQQNILVKEESDSLEVGDEPLLLFQNSNCMVMVSNDRVSSAKILIDQYDCNILLCDDGLQNLRLGRDIEISVVDGIRRFQNQLLIPAGPLREPVAQHHKYDIRLSSRPQKGETKVSMIPIEFVAVGDESKVLELTSPLLENAHAVAGIGFPSKFFESLEALNIHFDEKIFPDHHQYRSQDLQYSDDLPVLMTEKDAVKCRAFAQSHWWYLKVRAEPNPTFGDQVLTMIEEL